MLAACPMKLIHTSYLTHVVPLIYSRLLLCANTPRVNSLTLHLFYSVLQFHAVSRAKVGIGKGRRVALFMFMFILFGIRFDGIRFGLLGGWEMRRGGGGGKGGDEGWMR